MSANDPLRGKTALVTGASKGIGLAIARLLVGAGMNVTLTARHEDEVERAASLLGETGPGRALGLACDVRDFEQVKRAVERTLDTFDGLDAVVANAGVGRFGAVDGLHLDDWRAVIDTNLSGAFHTIKASVPALTRSHGTIITIGSLAGTNFFAGGAAYNASKFGLLGLTQAAMLDLRPHGIKVSTIMPGSVATYFNDHTPGPEDAWKIQPEDIGETVLYLLRTPQRTLPSRIEVRPSQPPRR